MGESLAMDALFLLLRDHHELADLFRRYHAAAPSAAEERAALAADIRQRLLRHAQREQEHVYPALAPAADGARPTLPPEPDWLFTARQQSGRLHSAATGLAEAPPGSADHEARMAAAADELQAHIRFANAELFPAVRRRLSGSELSSLGQRIEESEEEAPWQEASAATVRLMDAAVDVAAAFSQAVDAVLADTEPRRRRGRRQLGRAVLP